LDQIVPLVRRLDACRPDVRIILRGSGSERARIERILQGQGVSNTVFQELVPAAELAASIQAAHLHLVPQASNVANYALPSKLVSIMAAGRPFLAIAEPGSPSDHLARASGAGLCLPPGDEAALFETVIRILGDPSAMRAMGCAGREFVRKNMST